MNLKSVLSRSYSNNEIFSIMRALNGWSIFVYFILVLLPQYDELFSSRGFINPESFTFFPGSWLFSIWEHETLKIILFGFYFVLIVCYMIGFYTRWVQLLLLPLQLAFHNAVPVINHEPQQLNNLLLLILCFAPAKDQKESSRILFALQIYLGTYYFFAGLKKLPDPSWINGMAVAKLSSWEFLGRDNIFKVFCQIPFVSMILTYLTLVFEMSFLAVSFTRFRSWLIPIGLSFHLGISLTLDIGMFFWSMLMWYPLCLRRAEN